MRRVTLEVAFSPQVQDTDLGETLGLTWIFPDQKLVVGRSKDDADLAMETDGTISKRHFEVAFDGTTCMLTDLGTTNGTYVNGKRIQRIELRNGDKIEAGKTQFTLGILDVPDATSRSVDETWRQRPDLTEAVPLTPMNVSAPEQGSIEPNAAEPNAAEQDVSEPKSAQVSASTATSEPSAVSPTADGPSDSDEPVPSTASDYGFVTLAVTSGPYKAGPQDEISRQLVWIRAGQRIKIGRSVWDADWVIPADPMMSGLHFEVFFDGRQCRIKDLDSSNGTFVNDESTDSCELNSGDKIRAGETTFELQFS